MPATFSRYGDNILTGSTVSGATPATGYTAANLLSTSPLTRVRYSSTTVTITFTLGSSLTGAILVIPIHNLTPGSSSVLTLTNGAGLSQAIPVPALMANGLPPVLAYDFSALANRTSTVWNLVISGNANTVQIGGGVSIFSTVRTFAGVAGGNVNWQFNETEHHFFADATNEYGSVYTQDYQTHQRSCDISAIGLQSQLTAVQDWYRANHGGALPSLFWPDPTDSSGAYYGRFGSDYTTSTVTSKYKKWSAKFIELPRGKAIT